MITLEQESTDHIEQYPNGSITRNGIPMKEPELSRYKEIFRYQAKLKKKEGNRKERRRQSKVDQPQVKK